DDRAGLDRLFPGASPAPRILCALFTARRGRSSPRRRAQPHGAVERPARLRRSPVGERAAEPLATAGSARSRAFVARDLFAPLPSPVRRTTHMLSWIALFLVLALLAALFGFGGIASGFASIAQILFFVFLVLLIVAVLMRLTRRTV